MGDGGGGGGGGGGEAVLSEIGNYWSVCDIPRSIFTATVVVEFASFFNEERFMIPLYTFPNAPRPSSSYIVTSSLFTSHLSFI